MSPITTAPQLTPRQQIDALLDLIKTSAYQALDEYEKYGQPLPSLDSLTSHPLDGFVDSRNHPPQKTHLEPGRRMRPALHEPSASFTYSDQLCSCWLRPFTHPGLGIADAIAASSSGSLRTSDLSRQFNVEESKLTTMLRLLATRHCFREVDKDVFSNNRLSVHITSRGPISGWIDFLTSYSATGALNLYDALTDPDYAL
ncbi:hypothetical protein D9613_011691 [Agrocybe pediades]|uniref:O-methyltransferase dimerisation domain-containing protein n=1 Tax=Agrocybe pediades TaxID=84607 RepID=A0A8H4QW82_9AGAR|nr:hypothetical protein D9613_011691 [Agrocybe pediades]